MKKWIIWIAPTEKSIRYNQFWTERETMQEALESLKANAQFDHKILGVTNYMSISILSDQEKINRFVNESFH